MELVLNAHGIMHTVRREDSEAATDWPRYISVDESDFDRATSLVRDLQFTPIGEEPRGRRFIIVSFAAILLMLAGIVFVLLKRG